MTLIDRARRAAAAFAHSPPTDNLSPRTLMTDIADLDPHGLFNYWQSDPYNPDTLVQRKGNRIYDEMRADEQAHSALMFKKMAVMQNGFHIISPPEEEDDWEVTEYVRNLIDYLPGTFEQTLLQIMTAFDYGYSVTEKTFAEADSGPYSGLLHLHSLITKYPYSFDFKTDRAGNMLPDGLIQDTDRGRVRLPVAKFLIYTNFFEFGNYYGRSDLRQAYRPWWIKENSMRWLAQMLERYGIPPVFFMYDPDVYKSRALTDKIIKLLKNLRAASNALVPRPSQKGPDKSPALEPWAPELASGVEDVFNPTLRMLDQQIARAILMPSLVGVTAGDDKAGSLARGRVSFDAFLLIIQFNQSQMAEAINDCIIRPAVDLNFNVDHYPAFEFNKIIGPDKLKLFEQWTSFVEKSVVHPLEADEVHLRALFGMPEFDPDEAAEQDEANMPPAPLPGQEQTDSDIKEETLALFDEALPTELARFGLSRTPNKFEHSVDFQQVQDELNELEDAAVEGLSSIFIRAQDLLLRQMELREADLAQWLVDLKALPLRRQMHKEVERMLMDAYNSGFAQAEKEIGTSRFASMPLFIPTEAIRYLRKRALIISGVLNDRVLADVKAVMIAALERGDTLRELQKAMREVLEPYVGDPTVIRDGDIIKPHRLESIIRTNTTAAINQGRIVSARRSGEFLTGFEYAAILDARTTEVCRFLDGRVFRKDDPALGRLKPPRHHQCRSLLVPVTIDVPVEEDEFVTPAQAGRGQELSGQGF